MNTIPPVVLPDVLCPTCHHPLSAHDAISSRWCAVTGSGVGHRECICSGVTHQRVPAHY
ncbi:RGCVC family protein [Microlunatus panaciterrae]|uniref:RGCVC family protein n=1 Tax=Microlunatus panaciterrae TaxID=400768 RepID=UPI00195EE70B